MQERRRNILIGLFVLGGLICLGILVLLFGTFPNVVSGRTTTRSRSTSPRRWMTCPSRPTCSCSASGSAGCPRSAGGAGSPARASKPPCRSTRTCAIPSNAAAEYKEATMGFGRPAHPDRRADGDRGAGLPADQRAGRAVRQGRRPVRADLAQGNRSDPGTHRQPHRQTRRGPHPRRTGHPRPAEDDAGRARSMPARPSATSAAPSSGWMRRCATSTT